MINLDEINNSLPKGYYLEIQKGEYYFLRKASTRDVLVYYKKETHQKKEDLFDKLNAVILKHEKRTSGIKLGCDRNSLRDKERLKQEIEEKKLSLVE